MTRGRARTLRTGRSRVWLHALLVAALLAGACSSEGKSSAPPIATVRGHEIFESDVEELAKDAGFVAFIRAPSPETGADLSQTEAGRRTLTWLIDKALVEAELAAQHLTVEDKTLEQTTADLRAGETPPELNVIVDAHQAMGVKAFSEVAQGLAAYSTLDQWLRTIDPNSADLRTRIVTDHPEVRDRVCGAAVAVDEASAGSVRDLLNGGGTLDQVADNVTLARTPPEGVCLTRGSFRRQLVDVLYGTPVGSAGEKRVISRSTGKPVVYFVVPSTRDKVPDDKIDLAVVSTLQRLQKEGGAAFAELGFATVDPHLGTTWGRWDPDAGVVASNAAPLFSSFVLPPPTTTTTAPTTTAPAPPSSPPADFVEASEPILAGDGPGDPGTGNLIARSDAALQSAIPSAWRQAVPLQILIIGGSTSWSATDGQLKVGTVHATGDWFKLVAVMAHEFGHHLAFRYGSQSELGAAPAGWPTSGSTPVERWADCVSQTFTSYGLATQNPGPCGGESLSWTEGWLAPGPAGYAKTG